MNRSQGTYQRQAIVLRIRNIGEKDRVMTLLAAEGKFCAVARGARAPRSKLAAISQPFVLARFLVAHGRSIDIATQAETENSFPRITTDLLKTAWASYCCELCDLVPEHQPELELFELLHSALATLDESETRDDFAAVGHWFEARFLVALGYAPVIGRCVAGGEKIAVASGDLRAKVAFSGVLGGTLCRACLASDAQRILVSAEGLRALYALMNRSAPPQGSALPASAAARRDLRDCLRGQIRHHLDARLKSQRFLDDMLAAS